MLAPTDALAISALLKRAGGPEALVVLMEGESLLNDASGESWYCIRHESWHRQGCLNRCMHSMLVSWHMRHACVMGQSYLARNRKLCPLPLASMGAPLFCYVTRTLGPCNLPCPTLPLSSGIVLFDLFATLVRQIAREGPDAADSPLSVIPGMAMEIARLALGNLMLTICHVPQQALHEFKSDA